MCMQNLANCDLTSLYKWKLLVSSIILLINSLLIINYISGSPHFKINLNMNRFAIIFLFHFTFHFQTQFLMQWLLIYLSILHFKRTQIAFKNKNNFTVGILEVRIKIIVTWYKTIVMLMVGLNLLVRWVADETQEHMVLLKKKQFFYQADADQLMRYRQN